MNNEDKLKLLQKSYSDAMSDLATVYKKIKQTENRLKIAYNECFGTQELFDSSPLPSKPKSLYSKGIRELYKSFYENEKGVKIKIFTAKDHAAVLRIIKKIQAQIDEPDLEKDENEVVYEIFKWVLETSKKDKFVFENMSIMLLDQQMDKLLAKLRKFGSSKLNIMDKLKYQE